MLPLTEQEVLIRTQSVVQLSGAVEVEFQLSTTLLSYPILLYADPTASAIMFRCLIAGHVTGVDLQLKSSGR